MTYLFFDTETTGLLRGSLPLGGLAATPAETPDSWPRLVQLAWLLISDNNELLSAQSDIIRPDGFAIPETASSIHGITTYRALSHGESLTKVLSRFSAAIARAELLVCHNFDFDAGVCGAEFLRSGFPNPITAKRSFCTMKQSAAIIGIPRLNGQAGKYPTLSELHQHCFGTPPAATHNASADVAATARCFFALLSVSTANPSP
jgi:DNA polymerase III epsilon subunit-like protein